MRCVYIFFFSFIYCVSNAQNFSATSVQYSYGTHFDDVGAGLDMEDKRLNTLLLDHYGTWKGGDNFYFVNLFSGNFLDSDRNPSDIQYKMYGEWNPRINLLQIGKSKIDRVLPATPSTEELDILSLEIYFNYIDVNLNKTAEILLDRIFEFLHKYPEEKIIIEGHSCNIQQDSLKSKTLSINRAKAVQAYLVQKGIAIERLIIVGYGEEKPVLSNETEYGRVKNRRVEFRRDESYLPSITEKVLVQKEGKFAMQNIYLTGQINQGNNFNAVMIGLGFRFKLPAFSFFDVHCFVYRADNFGNQSYQITGVWLMPLRLSKRWHFSFQGYFDLTKTSFSGTDFISQPNVTLDLSQLTKDNPSTHLKLGLEWFYHHNKLGITSSPQMFARFTW